MTRGVVRFRSYVARGDVFIGKSLRLAQMKLGLLSLAYSSCYWLVCVRHWPKSSKSSFVRDLSCSTNSVRPIKF